MAELSYHERKSEIETYFDRTALSAWAALTSDAPVSRIRATVRAGRDQMRATLLSWLPNDLRGLRLLDAGCGTGAFAIEAARRGASVVAIDLSPNLIALAKERAPKDLGEGSVEFSCGDMNYPTLGKFDYVVAMDSLIHYSAPDVVRVLEGLAWRARHSVLFTFAPKTPALAVMHYAGRLFPRKDRAPSIIPVVEAKLKYLLSNERGLVEWRTGRTQRIVSGFYTSQALELKKQ